jgi:hypothetical protein
MMNWTHSASIVAFACMTGAVGCGGEQPSSGGDTQGTSSSSVTSSATSGSSSSSTGGGGGGGAGGAGAGGGDAGSVDCSPIANTATEIEETFLNQDPPTPVGGTIAAGNYEVTSRVIYTGPTGMTGKTGAKFKATLNIETVSPGKLQLKIAISVNGSPDQNSVFTASADKAHLSATPLCGGMIPLMEEFDATPTELKTYFTFQGKPLLAIFTKK